MSFDDFENLDFGEKNDFVYSIVAPIPLHVKEDAEGEERIDVSELRECSIVETYNCPICLDIIQRPRLLSCGHVYCRICVLKVIELGVCNTIRCPVCRDCSPITKIVIFDLFARSMKESIILLRHLADAKKRVKKRLICNKVFFFIKFIFFILKGSEIAKENTRARDIGV